MHGNPMMRSVAVRKLDFKREITVQEGIIHIVINDSAKTILTY
jgi:hypothetical protein